MAVCGNININYQSIVKSADKNAKKQKKPKRSNVLVENPQKIPAGTCGNIQ